MGKGFATRRGGLVKTGTVSNVQELSISDPALIGCKNAVLVAQTHTRGAPYSENPLHVVTIIIENGKLSQVMVIDGERSDPARYEVKDPPKSKMAFDPTTGTITSTDPHDPTVESYEFMAKPDDGSDILQTYRYYIWD